MPHWACHYYRLETGSSFVVGSWEFSKFDSAASLLIYSGFIALNLIAVARLRYRRMAALISGFVHVAIGSLHCISANQAISV
jgi:hypothetical protein